MPRFFEFTRRSPLDTVSGDRDAFRSQLQRAVLVVSGIRSVKILATERFKAKAALPGWDHQNLFPCGNDSAGKKGQDRQGPPASGLFEGHQAYSGGIIRKFWLSTIIAVVALGTAANLRAADAGSKDPRVGSWTLVSAQSALTPANKLSVTDVKGGVHVVISGENHLDFTAKSDGKETAVPGNPAFNQVELHRIDKKQSEVREKKDGSLVATVSTRLSGDGKELTVTTVRAGHPDQIEVWTRSGSTPAGKDPLAGEWTQDLTKSRLRQGLVLKIEQDGSGGVRFSGEFSYTARFDGKPYDVKNSRNDSVTLALVDTHTVDAIYRRDEQVTQKDRWVVAADGQQLTLTTSGTLETGQRVTEKLVFKKR